MSMLDPVILNELSRLAKSMSDNLAALSASVTGVDGKVINVNNGVGTVSGQVTTVNNAVAALQGTVNTINNTVNAINAKTSAAMKGAQQVIGTNANWISDDPNGIGSARYLDVAISAVAVGKAVVTAVRPFFKGGDGNSYPLAYMLLNATTVRCHSFVNGNNPGAYAFTVQEFY